MVRSMPISISLKNWPGPRKKFAIVSAIETDIEKVIVRILIIPVY